MKVVVCFAILACVAFSTTHAFYSRSDDVIELTPDNFQEKVINSKDLWIVEFYAPWCGHCQALTPEYKKAATALKGVVKIGAVDADNHKSLGGQYGVRGFPTIKIFGSNKQSPEDYNGARTASGIVDTAMQKLKSLVNERLSGRSGGSSGGGSGGGSKGSPDDVIELTEGNFQSKVLDSDEPWLVEFFAPWCGHCKNLKPHWESAASQLKGKMKLGAVDATVHQGLAGQYGVRGYPTIKYFPAGVKSEAVEYDGGRTADDIVAWASDKVEENLAPPEINELTSQSVLTTACDDHQLCIISILPHILDCQSKCRNDYITVLRELGDKYKKRQWGWVWAEAGAQPEVEESLGIGGFGYPAMAAVNSRKMKYSLMKGSFGTTGINEFLRELAVGRGSTAPVKNAVLPTVQDTPAWDGKDGELPVEDDWDLSDVDLDDLDDVKTEL